MSVFDEFEEKHGKGEKCQSVSDKILAKYEDKLPSELIEEWSQNGWCSYGKGLLWTVNPADYEDTLSEWISDSQKYFVFLRSAFADIYYSDGEKNYHLDTSYGRISKVYSRIDFVFNGNFCDEKYLESVLRQSLFDKAFSKLGKLETDECYGFFPALALGGEEEIEYVQKAKIREYLSILSQIKREK